MLMGVSGAEHVCRRVGGGLGETPHSDIYSKACG